MIFLNVRTRFCCHIDLLTHREAVTGYPAGHRLASFLYLPITEEILLNTWRLSCISSLLSVPYIVMSLSQCRVLYTLGITIINIELS